MPTPGSTAAPSDGRGGAGASEDAVFAVGFDQVRMGSGIGEEWRQTAGAADAVAVAAVPTAVDRSARLVVLEGADVETCRSIQPPMSPVGRLSVEFLLSTATAQALMTVGVAPGEPELRISLGASGTKITESGTRVLAEGGALDTLAWYRAEVVVEGVTTHWRVTPLDGSSAPVPETTVEAGAPGAIGEVCLGVSGESQDEVYFDNLTIVIRQGG